MLPDHVWNTNGFTVERIVLNLNHPKFDVEACRECLVTDGSHLWRGPVTLRGGSYPVWNALLSGVLLDTKPGAMTGIILESFGAFPGEMWELLASLLRAKPEITTVELRDIRSCSHNKDVPLDSVVGFLDALAQRRLERLAFVGGGRGAPYNTCSTSFVALFVLALMVTNPDVRRRLEEHAEPGSIGELELDIDPAPSTHTHTQTIAGLRVGLSPGTNSHSTNTGFQRTTPASSRRVVACGPTGAAVWFVYACTSVR